MVFLGCSKSPSGEAAPAASASTQAPPATAPADQPPVPAETVAAVPAVPTEQPAHEPAAAPKPPAAAGTPKTSAAASAPKAETSAAAGPKTFTCGNKGQPPCPTQRWMKSNMAPAAASGDAPELAKLLDYVAAHAPAGMPNWASIAKAGASKARAGDVEGAKASCKTCHDQYKAKYKAEVRDREF